jgi:hypothetical protein
VTRRLNLLLGLKNGVARNSFAGERCDGAATIR